jgi:threonine/homoserine/homoserine lactone efflux protein
MGLAFAAPPGAVTAETLRRGARGGFMLALGVQLGSLVGDATYALLALAGLAALAQNQAIQFALGTFGALFLLYLAVSSLYSALVPTGLTLSATKGAGILANSERRSAFLSGMGISLANPWAIAFWLSLGGVLGSLGVAAAGPLATAFFFVSFMLGAAGWSLALAAFVGRMHGLMRPGIFRVVSIICAVALGGFGILAISRLIFSAIGA